MDRDDASQLPNIWEGPILARRAVLCTSQFRSSGRCGAPGVYADTLFLLTLNNRVLLLVYRNSLLLLRCFYNWRAPLLQVLFFSFAA
jgi:hypothetical protein